MPIYEYEPDGHDCLMCDGRVQAIQAVGEEPLRYCPQCGLEVRRVISQVSFKFVKHESADKAARHGLSTFKRAESGVWEKIAGPGVDAIVSSDEDRAAIKAEKEKPSKILDLDKEP